MSSPSIIEIKVYSKEYKYKVIMLLRFMWLHLSDEERIRRFEWRYEKNPFSSNPKILIAVCNDEVVGFRAFVVQNFLLREKCLKVFSPADAIIHPDFRRMGIFKKLNTMFIEKIYVEFKKEECLILNLSSNQYSTPGYLKQGWKETTGCKKYAYKVNLLNIIKSKFRKNEINNWSEIKVNGSMFDIEICSILYYDELSKFCKNHINHKKISNNRNHLFFEWRYTQEQSDYCYAYLRKNNYLFAYIILKKNKNNQVIIEEYGFRETKVFQVLLKRVIKNNKIAILRTKVINKFQAKLVKKCGFFVETQFFLKIFSKTRLPVLVRPNAINPKKQDFIYYKLDIRDIENWDIYQADSH